MGEMKRQQERISEFLREHELNMPVQERLLDLNSELGEVSKEVLKGTKYGTRAFQLTDAWQEELGDLLYCVLALAAETGIDADLALDGALSKYERRLVAHDNPGSDAPTV